MTESNDQTKPTPKDAEKPLSSGSEPPKEHTPPPADAKPAPRGHEDADASKVRKDKDEGFGPAAAALRLGKFLLAKFWMTLFVPAAYFGGAFISVNYTGGTPGSGARWGLGFLFGFQALLFLLFPKHSRWAVRVGIVTALIGAIVFAITFAVTQGPTTPDPWLATSETNAGQFGVRWFAAGVIKLCVLAAGMLIVGQLKSRSGSRKISGAGPRKWTGSTRSKQPD